MTRGLRAAGGHRIPLAASPDAEAHGFNAVANATLGS